MIRNRRRVVVTGLGVVSPIGTEPNEFFENLLSGRSGIRRFGDSGQVVGSIAGFDPLLHFTKAQLVGLDRVSQFGLVAANQALQDAALSKDSLNGTNVGVYLGTGIGGANALETGYERNRI